MIIGITGKAGAGKDTVADYLVNKGFRRYAFADAVREVALSINPIIMTNWSTAELDSNMPTLSEIRLKNYVNTQGWDWSKRNVAEIRRLLQVIGTEAGRQVLGENVWVDIVFKKWREANYPDAVITDMRFPNEFNAISDEGEGVTLKVVRPNNPNAIMSTHASEAHDFDCDYTLTNDASLDKLYADTDRVLEFIGINIGG